MDSRSRDTPSVDGDTAPITSAPNRMPSCDRSMRWISSWRRDTGAGNRNCSSGSENSSRPLSTGVTHAAAATTSSATPLSCGISANSAAIDSGKSDVRGRRRAERPVARKRAKKLK